MKRKLLVLCLVVMFVLPATVFAGGLVGLKVGAAAILNYPVDLETFEPAMVEELSIEDFSFGADIRANVSILQLSALVQGRPADIEGVEGIVFGDDMMILEGHIGLGVSLELMGLVNLGVTAGPMFGALVGEDVFGEAIFLPTVNMGDGNYFPLDDEMEVLEYAPLTIRVTADVNLGGISAGLFAMVNSGVTIGNLIDPDFDFDGVTIDPNAVVGVSVLVALL